MITKTVKPKKIPDGSLKFELFGDLLKISRSSPSSTIQIKKYEDFCIALTEKSRDERLLLYKFLCGIALTAHARRTTQEAPRKVIYDVKNELFFSVVNNFSNRKVLNFRMCVSPRFKVLEYCAACVASNTESGTERRDWKFCKKCKVDRSYYNLLSAYHRFTEGGVAMFLSQDLLEKVFPIKELKKVPMGKFKEELVFGRFHFSPQNLQSVQLDSLLKVCEKLLKLAPATLVVDPEKSRKAARTNDAKKPPVRRPAIGATRRDPQPRLSTPASKSRTSVE
jgi:hypothetical protein